MIICGQELVGCHALVIPGGESTTMVKVMEEFKMFDDIKGFGTKVMVTHRHPPSSLFHTRLACTSFPCWRLSIGRVPVLVPVPVSLSVRLPRAGVGLFEDVVKTERTHLRDMAGIHYTQGFPIFGTCAGCIMLSKDIEGMSEQKTLGLCDITVCRNAYGRQVDSFESLLEGDHTVFGEHAINAVLIRAPMIKRAGPGTQTLLSHNNAPVLLREGNLLACTFHPEITGDTRIHTYFVNKMVRENGKAYTA